MLSSTQYPQRFLDLYNLAKDLSQHHQINLEKTFDNILEVENPQLTIMGIKGALGKKGFFLNKQEGQPLSEQEEQRKMTFLYQKYQNRQQIQKNPANLGQQDIGEEFLVILEQMQQRLELNNLKNIHELEGRLKKEFQQGKQEGVDIQQFIDFQEVFEKKFATFDQRIKSIQTKIDLKTQEQDVIEEMNEKIESLEHRLKEEEKKNKKAQKRYEELLERFDEFKESQGSQNSQWENKFQRLEELNKENRKPNSMIKKIKKKRSHSHSSSSSNDEEIQTSK